MTSIAERFAALPEWAQKWVADEVVGESLLYVYPAGTPDEPHYTVIRYAVGFFRDRSSPYEVLLRGDNITRIEAAEVMAAHYQRRTPRMTDSESCAAIESLSERDRRLYSCDCAERAVNAYFKPRYPEDKRPTEAIEVARRFARGEATEEERDAAWGAVGAAARDAANDAWSDVYYASTPCVAAYHAASAAYYASAAETVHAACSAAHYAVQSACIASYFASAPWAAERVWQEERIAHYLRRAREDNANDDLHSS